MRTFQVIKNELPGGIYVSSNFSPNRLFQKAHHPPWDGNKSCKKYKSTIHLLHVVEIIPNTTFTEYKTFYNNLEKKAQKEMGLLMSGYQEKSVQILPRISYGNRVQEILKFIKEFEIDLVIMNSHKVELKNPVDGWGTISYKVALLSESPVMLVK